jgi:hypothetical protein
MSGRRAIRAFVALAAVVLPGSGVTANEPIDPLGAHPVQVTACDRVPPARAPDPATRFFEAAIERARSREPDFAGCWRVIQAGCGTACQQIILVHPSSGATRWGPTVSAGADYRRDSEWLVTNARETSTPAPRRSYRFDSASAVLLPVEPVEAPSGALHLPPPAADARPAVSELRQRLQRIVDTHDHEALLALVAPDVIVSFGGDGGPEEFRAHWALDHAPRRSPVWEVLDRLLRLPPAADQPDAGKTWVTWPYYFDHWPDETPAYGRVFAADYAVPILARPATDAPLVTRASFAALTTADASAPNGWTAVRIDDGEVGFIAPGQPVFPVLGHRLLLHRADNGWRIDALVAGD